jgi:hypothetical protein
VGKTSLVYQAVKELAYEARVMIASTVDPVDIRGVMAIKGEFTEWVPPAFWRPSRVPIVFFFDELNTATPATQTGFYRLILEGRLDNIDISTHMRIGAGNRAQDMSVVNRMPGALVNRFHHIWVEPDFDDWKRWAYNNNIDPMVLAFHNFKGGSLLFSPPTERDKPFPSPRAWEYASHTVKMMRNNLSFEDIAGDVGDGAATEFMGFLNVYSQLPKSADEIVGKGIMFPKEPSKQCALNSMLASWYKVSPDRPRVLGEIMKYADALPKKEYAVILVRDLMMIDLRGVMACPAFTRWANDVRDLVVE